MQCDLNTLDQQKIQLNGVTEVKKVLMQIPLKLYRILSTFCEW